MGKSHRSIDPLIKASEAIEKDELKPGRKETTMTIRLSKADKESMLETARSLDLTLTEYVIRLHHLVEKRVKLFQQADKGKGS